MTGAALAAALWWSGSCAQDPEALGLGGTGGAIFCLGTGGAGGTSDGGAGSGGMTGTINPVVDAGHAVNAATLICPGAGSGSGGARTGTTGGQ